MSQSVPTSASLKAFAITGRLGGVALGETRVGVPSLLGPPSDWLAAKVVDAPALWKYGDIEFHFDDEVRVWLIHCDDFEGVRQGGGELLLDAWVVRGGLTFDELGLVLHDAGVQFDRRNDRFNPGRVELMTAAGVCFNVVVEP